MGANSHEARPNIFAGIIKPMPEPRRSRLLPIFGLCAGLIVTCVGATSLYWHGKMADMLSFDQVLDVLGEDTQPNRIRAAAEKGRRHVRTFIATLREARERSPECAESIDRILLRVHEATAEKGK
ncbi:MAG: hypothetical protein NXI31_11400 [bacterium]|nr:hypothetical protein [bacterium]